MRRLSALLSILLAVTLLTPSAGHGFDEIDQIGSNNFKPMRGCSNCHLRRVNRSGGIRWIGAILPKAELRKADLKDADMRGANFRAADLSKADLRNANISGADLRNADLSGANLTGTNLFKANMTGVRFKSAKLCRTTMPDGSIDNSGCGSPLEGFQPRARKPKYVATAKSQRTFSFLGFTINLP